VGVVRVTDERAEKALRYLAETDETCAELKTDAERMEFAAKAIKDSIFKRLAGSVADRQAEAGSNVEYENAMVGYFNALQSFEAMRNKRNTEALVIEVWRSVTASRRAGMIT
jgi:hypothetical protein